MTLQEVEFTSANGTDQVQAWIYTPTAEPIAVVQLVHGLGEHSRRYHHMIGTLLEAGIVVVADDHAGHGRTAMQSGVWADAGDEAARVVVDDELELRRRCGEQFPGLPHVVFGHSWGSMIARVMATRPDASLDGLALCGIAAQIRGLETVLDRPALAAALAEDPAAVAPEVLVGQMFDGFVERFGPEAGPTDWVAADAAVVADHAKDPFNNFGAPMTTRFLHGFAELYDQANGDDFYTALPDIPVVIFAGDQDPVANYGEGAYHVANRLVASGHQVSTHVYSGLRHEVHNEPSSRADVERRLVEFVQSVADARP